MKLRPLADRVVLKQLQAEEKTKSGLFIATGAQEYSLKCTRSLRSVPAALWTARKSL